MTLLIIVFYINIVNPVTHRVLIRNILTIVDNDDNNNNNFDESIK